MSKGVWSDPVLIVNRRKIEPFPGGRVVKHTAEEGGPHWGAVLEKAEATNERDAFLKK